MADPITILGAAGAVANIIDVLGKTISTIGELRSQWQDADLTVLNLESQLAALNTALNKIKAWTESSFEDPHHQFVMDLDRCVVCCRTLINKIDVEVSQFQTTAENRLHVASKFRLLLKTKDFENVQRMIEQQTGALTLLLTAANTTIISEQKEILQQSQTRRIFKKMQSDTESLYVHRDVDSLMTSNTATSISSSKRSILFEFDPELFVSRIYQRWIRGSVKKSLHEQQCETRYSPQPSLKSQAIDRLLEKDAKRLRRECKILLLGSESRGDILNMMKIHYLQGYSEDVLYSYRFIVFRTVCESAKALVNAMRQFEVTPESDKIWELADFIAAYVLDSDPTSSGLDPRFKTAIETILESPHYSEVMSRCTEFYLPHSAEYFFDKIAEIASPNYLPTDMDVLQTRAKTNSILETRFEMDQLSLCVANVSGDRSDRKKWMHCFENVTSIIFVADLDSYDQVSLEENPQNAIMESLLLFDSIVNSRWFMRTSVILFLNNVRKFKQKLAKNPLENYFRDYSGGNDVDKAAKYLIWRFNQVNRAHLTLYPHLVGPDNASLMRLVSSAVKQTILNNALRDDFKF